MICYYHFLFCRSCFSIPDTTEAWVGLTKPFDECSEDDYSCRRMGWNWEDETPYKSTESLWYDGSGRTQEPEPAELCAKLNQAHLYGVPCLLNSERVSCLCEKHVSTPSQSESSSCDFGWKMNKNSCYLMTPEKMIMHDCKETCSSKAAVITSIANEQENEVLTNL